MVTVVINNIKLKYLRCSQEGSDAFVQDRWNFQKVVPDKLRRFLISTFHVRLIFDNHFKFYE